MQDLTDFLAEEAAKIFTAAGQPRLEVRTSCTRRRDGSKCYDVTTYDPDGTRNPLDMHCAYGLGDSVEGVLGQVAAKLGVSYPLPGPATRNQREEIITLLNHPRIERREKTVGLLNINRYTTATAIELIAGLKKDINARSGHAVFLEVADYAVVGEAWLVAECDCGTDGCSRCEGGFVRKELTAAA